MMTPAPNRLAPSNLKATARMLGVCTVSVVLLALFGCGAQLVAHNAFSFAETVSTMSYQHSGKECTRGYAMIFGELTSLTADEKQYIEGNDSQESPSHLVDHHVLAVHQYEAGQYEQSGRSFVKASENYILIIASCYYNAACCYALEGQHQQSLEYLEMSVDAGFRNIEHIKADSDLDSIRVMPEFQRIMEKAK